MKVQKTVVGPTTVMGEFYSLFFAYHNTFSQIRITREFLIVVVGRVYIIITFKQQENLPYQPTMMRVSVILCRSSRSI